MNLTRWLLTIRDYFHGKPHTPEHEADAEELLRRVNGLLAEYVSQGGVMTVTLMELHQRSQGGAGMRFRLSST